MFPDSRPRRIRRTPALRALVRETTVLPSQLLLPIFILPGTGRREPIAALPGVDRLSPDLAAELAVEAAAVGVAGVLLFGLPEEKDAVGTSAWDPDGPVPSAVRAIRAAAPGLVIITDVCLCQYTDHGHCGLVGPHGEILNDASLPALARAAVAHARAGADLLFVESPESVEEMERIGRAFDLPLVANMVDGVSKGFEKRLEIQGVGYRAQVQGRNLILNVGYSKPVEMNPPQGITVAVENNTNVIVSGIDKEIVGNVAAQIRAVRPPEPYKGKGIRYAGELVRRKAGKTGKKK
jgi:large subunit ribosomal protein L6